ncbi:hypothetical protein EVAR_14553_1 [Eumeta japonica]|uniref:Uncharacterized protein n=1 Tax=Eumeta variegata TaxID=151549 RepID=A0A4C1U3Y9_EUMVA|nr:hypothetical protein EVAR_14553_1 [Eumeta japonica]
MSAVSAPDSRAVPAGERKCARSRRATFAFRSPFARINVHAERYRVMEASLDEASRAPGRCSGCARRFETSNVTAVMKLKSRPTVNRKLP